MRTHTSRRPSRLIISLLTGLTLVATLLASSATPASAAGKSWVAALCKTVPSNWTEGTVRPVVASVIVHKRGGRSKPVKGITVTVQRKMGGRWVTETKGRTNSRGVFTKKVALKGAGPLIYRCKVTYSKKFKKLKKLQQVVPIDNDSTIDRPSVASLTVQGPLYSDAPVTLTGTVSPVGVGRTVFFDTRPADSRSGATRYDYSDTPVRPDGTFSITFPRLMGTVTFQAQVGRSSDYNASARSNRVTVSMGSHDGLSIVNDGGSLPNAWLGQDYRYTLVLSDSLSSGRAGTWSLTSGALPPGLSLDGDSIVGTPTTAGTSTFTVAFTDAQNARVRATMTLRVDEP